MPQDDGMNATFGSLFAGIGGLDLGLDRAGWSCKWQVEIDPYCLAVLQKHWPNVPRFGDVKTLTGDELESVDLICGGFPCQPVSCAGKKKGQADERWLWPEFARIIRMVRPRFVLVENVPGLLNANEGRAMGEVLGDLAESGYDAEWNRVSAASVGAPHLRERIFIVAYSKYGGLAQVQKTDGCWLWTGAKNGVQDCYGRIQAEGGRGSRVLSAHHVAYELLVGQIPSGLCVLHHCDNPACVNPSHLFLGTKGDNCRDRTRKGRQARGERDGNAKLTQEQVREIRARYQRNSRIFGTVALGRQYGVACGTIWSIVRGQAWRDPQ